MRNLKRALSLALASVMLLGMMVVGTSAASYPDVDSADNLEAIEVLKTVGVMSGDENGNFNPDALVTRNEMAVVMCNLLGLKVGGTSPFVDVPAWAQPYVAACYGNGTIAGVSATEFGGSANVTAAQAALMVMKALGYFGYQGEFGNDWKVATIKQATKIDLFGDLNVYADEALTRNEVAQLVLNALESNVVVVTEEGGMSVEGNGITVNQQAKYDVKNAQDKAGHNYDRGADDGILQLCEKLYGSSLKKDTDGQDDFGRPANKWTYKAKTVTAPKKATATYTEPTMIKTIYADLGLKQTETAANVYGNGRDIDVWTTITIDKTTETKIGGNGQVMEFYVDSNKAITDVVMYNYILVQATADYDAVAEKLYVYSWDSTLGITELKQEDFNVSGYKDEDFLLLTATTTNGTSYTVRSVEPANIVSDVKVSAYKANGYVTAGGSTYNYAYQLKNDSSALGYTTAITGTYSLQSGTYDLVLDPYGYVLGVQPHTSADVLADYVFVKDATTYGFDYLAKVVFMDGTSKTVTVSKTAKAGGAMTAVSGAVEGSGLPSADGKLAWGSFYTFSIDKNGNYELTSVAASRQCLDATDINGTLSVAQPISGGSYSYTATNDSVFVAKDKAYTGAKNAPVVTGTTVYQLADANGYLMAAYTADIATSTHSDTRTVYILSADGTGKDANDVTYYVYDAIENGQKVKFSSKTSAATTGLYEIRTIEDGYGKLDTLISSDQGKYALGTIAASAISYKAGTMTVSGVGAGYYTLASDATLYLFDKPTETVKTLSTANLNNMANYGANFHVYVIVKDAVKDHTAVSVLFIEQ